MVKKLFFSLVWISLLFNLVSCRSENEASPITSGPAGDTAAPNPDDTDGDPLPEMGPPPTEMAPEKAAYSVASEERPCNLFVPAGEVVGETIRCGYVVMPAERDNQESKEVKLATVILKATGENPAPDPIVHISGGPGISATSPDVVVELLKRYAPLREMRDIVLYDQRGVGNSQPVLNCFAFFEEVEGDKPMSRAEINVRCQEELRNHGYPPETFSTAVSAADLVDLMEGLGYPTYNLYGISYGARLLMSLMHYFPNETLVRSIVLDSVDTLPEDAGTAYRAETYLLQQALFESVFEECGANTACAYAYPDLRTIFDALFDQLDQTPLTLDEFTTIDGDELNRYIFPYNSLVQNIPFQPLMIAELEQGITETLEHIQAGDIPVPATLISVLPPEPPSAQDLRELYDLCKASVSSTGELSPGRLMGLWDAEPGDVADFLIEICEPETSVPAVQIINENPRIFNHVILYYANDVVIRTNKDLNNKLNCTELFPFREDFDEIEGNLRIANTPDFFIEETLYWLNDGIDGCEAWQDALTAPTPDNYCRSVIWLVRVVALE